MVPVLAIAVLAISLLSGYRIPASVTIRISGTGSAVETMRILAGMFMKSNPGIRVEVFPGIGSGGGVRAVLAGRLDIGLSGRELTAEERAQGLVQTTYARTPFVFGVNQNLKMTDLTLEEVAGIYSGERDWENSKRIRLVLRPPDDSDIPVLKEMSPVMREAVDIAMRRKGMMVAMTDHEAADAIQTVPGAFGGTTLALFLSEKREFRILSLNGVAPSVRNMLNGTYPYSKSLQMITRKDASDPVRRFVEFVCSPAGAAVLARNGQAPVRRERPLR